MKPFSIRKIEPRYFRLEVRTVTWLQSAGPTNHGSICSAKQILGPTQPPIQQIIWALLLNVSSQGIKLTTHLHLVVRVIMIGEIPPLPFMLARCAQGQLYFTFRVIDQGVKVKMSTFIQSSH